MSASVGTVDGKSNSVDAVSGIRNAYVGNISLKISDLFREIFPRKTWSHLGRLIGTKERVSKHRLAGTREYSVEELASLLRSAHGRKVLAVLMGSAKPKWYLRLVQLDAVADAHILARQSERQLERAIAVRDELYATIASAEASLAVRDADFHQHDIDGLRAARDGQGATHRAVVTQTKRGT